MKLFKTKQRDYYVFFIKVLTTLLILFLISINLSVNAQNVAINDNGNPPNLKAILDLDISTNDMGVLLPRLTTVQRTGFGVAAGEASMLVYDTDTDSYWYWDGVVWVELGAAGGADYDWEVNGNNIYTGHGGLYPSGNVGIGTSTPSYKLHLYGTSNNAADVYSQTDAGRIVKHWFVNGSRSWSIGQIGTTSTPTYSFIIKDETASATRLLINTSGYVGIGETTPSDKLVIAGTASANDNRVKIGYTGSYNNVESGRLAFDEDVSSSGICGFEFHNDGNANNLYLDAGCPVMSNIMTFERTGDIGIGTTNPSQDFHVAGNVRIDNGIHDGTSFGTSGNVLTSDGAAIYWADLACDDLQDGFETNFGNWNNVSGDDDDWSRHTGSTSSTNTGPTAANEGSYYLYCETSGSVAGDQYFLQTEMTTCVSPSITFDYHMYFDVNTDGTLVLEISTNGGSTWTSLWTQTGNQGTAWFNDQTISLAGYANSTIMLRFRFTVGAMGMSYEYDCALDDINLIDMDGSTIPNPDDDWVRSGNYLYTTFETSVGIGTTTPTGKLHVDASATTSGTKYGIYNYLDNQYAGYATDYGIYNYVRNNTSNSNNSSQYGIRNSLYKYGTGTGYGLYNYLYNYSSGTSYCGYFSSSRSSDVASNYGVRGYAYNGTYVYGIYGYGSGGSTASYAVYAAGNFTCTGTKAATVRTEEGPKSLYCQESPENWFEDFGNGEINNGKSIVKIKEDYLMTVTINDQHSMKVFVTPNGNMGEWWVEKQNDCFIVHAPSAQNGTEFDFRIVAKRKGYEDLRLKYAPEAYADHFLYPDIEDVPLEHREEWQNNSDEIDAEQMAELNSKNTDNNDHVMDNANTEETILSKEWGTLSLKQQFIEDMKTEMKAAREDNDMELFEILKSKVQELNKRKTKEWTDISDEQMKMKKLIEEMKEAKVNSLNQKRE